MSSANVTRQLGLNLRLRDGSSLENFYVGDNAEIIDRLRGVLADPSTVSGPALLYLWGESGSGKTHLLEAACRFVRARGAPAFYLPLAAPGISPAALEGLEHSFLICLDDVQHVAGDAAWEAALFACYELIATTGARLVTAGTAAPTHAGFKSPALTTRFGAGSVYRLHALSDGDKLDAILLRARHRGFDMPAEVGRYILHRYPRDPVSLFALLDRIDAASLTNQRRITVPFLRQIEASGSEK